MSWDLVISLETCNCLIYFVSARLFYHFILLFCDDIICAGRRAERGCGSDLRKQTGRTSTTPPLYPLLGSQIMSPNKTITVPLCLFRARFQGACVYACHVCNHVVCKSYMCREMCMCINMHVHVYVSCVQSTSPY